MKKALSAFLLLALVDGLLVVVNANNTDARASTEVKGVISQDSTWTVQGSPYLFTGAVGIAEGVTLTIEAGVTVNIGSYYLQVNGSLKAAGTPTQKVVFTADVNPSNDAIISWADAHPLASGQNNIVAIYGNPTITIHNALLNNTSIFAQGLHSNAAVFITDCALLESSVNVWGKAIVIGSYVMGSVSARGVSLLTENTILGGVTVIGNGAETFTVLGNNITSNHEAAIIASGGGTIQSNFIYNACRGITQEDKTTLSAIIRQNLIKNNEYGIYLRDNSNDAAIVDNTFTANKVGIFNPSYRLTIAGNSFIDNAQYDIRAGSNAVSAASNWWGTTDRQAIEQKIFDSKDDFSLGTVVYVPFLTTPNVNAPDSDMCTVSQAPFVPTPTQVGSISYQAGGKANASINCLEIGLIATVMTVCGVLAALAVRTHRCRRL